MDTQIDKSNLKPLDDLFQVNYECTAPRDNVYKYRTAIGRDPDTLKVVYRETWFINLNDSAAGDVVDDYAAYLNTFGIELYLVPEAEFELFFPCIPEEAPLIADALKDYLCD